MLRYRYDNTNKSSTINYLLTIILHINKLVGIKRQIFFMLIDFIKADETT